MYNQNRPIIIAICGKSASGKDTLAKWMLSMARASDLSANIIVSDTTRPRRVFEKDKVDYNFLTESSFYNKINKGNYLEYSCFNGWFYGIDKEAIIPNNINIGVFNLDGIFNLANYQDKFEIICIYLKCGLIKRLIRSYKREKKFKLEYIRRAYNDHYDFKRITSLLNHFSSRFIFDTSKISTVSIVDYIFVAIKNNRSR